MHGRGSQGALVTGVHTFPAPQLSGAGGFDVSHARATRDQDRGATLLEGCGAHEPPCAGTLAERPFTFEQFACTFTQEFTPSDAVSHLFPPQVLLSKRVTVTDVGQTAPVTGPHVHAHSAGGAFGDPKPSSTFTG
jgi:hypothetical protein